MEELTVSSRLKVLRKSLKLNQSEFAERLGLTYSAISLVELGKTSLTEQNIKLICLTFGVRDEWLRTGKGEIFSKESPEESELLEKFRSLSPEMQKTIIKIVQELVRAQEEAREAPPAPLPSTKHKSFSSSILFSPFINK
jgi:transcriptional regulator with XRE-family HTH domain